MAQGETLIVHYEYKDGILRNVAREIRSADGSVQSLPVGMPQNAGSPEAPLSPRLLAAIQGLLADRNERQWSQPALTTL